MIFATVGMQLPFPRFVTALDTIAGKHGLEIIVQTVENVPGLRNVDQRPSMSPCDFDTLAAQARVIAGHAGIGTIISAERFQKPIILFPRVAALGEHRNEHQLATVRNFEDREGIYVAETVDLLEQLLLRHELSAFRAEEGLAHSQLQQHIAKFVDEAGGNRRGNILRKLRRSRRDRSLSLAAQ